MKPASAWTFTSMMIIGLTAGGAALRAQPASNTISVEGDDKPWNQGVPRAVRQDAREIFLEGNRLFSIPLIAQAAEQYTLALGKWNHPGFHYNLALAELSLGRIVEARDDFEAALQHGEEPLGPDRFRDARKQRQDLEHRLGRIRVSCQTDGAEVTLDGATLFTAPGSREVWVAPRSHEITAQRTEYLPEARRVTVSADQIKTLDLRLITLSEAKEGSRRWPSWKSWAVVGGGAAIAAAAGGLHVLALSTFHDFDNRFGQLPCAKNGGCNPPDIPGDVSRRLRHAELEQKIAIGGYITGGALVAAGAVLVYLNRPHLEPFVPGSSGTVAIVPAVAADSVGVLVTVRR